MYSGEAYGIPDTLDNLDTLDTLDTHIEIKAARLKAYAAVVDARCARKAVIAPPPNTPSTPFPFDW